MEVGDIASRPHWAARNHPTVTGTGDVRADPADPRFRGGTVAGHVHLDQCAALLVEEYGKCWFEQGAVSLSFSNVTNDGERVQALCEVPHGGRQVGVWLRREDGMEVAAGTASVADHDQSALRTRELRAVDPSDLRILRSVSPGATLGEWRRKLEADVQLERFRSGFISDPLSWYGEASPWGGPLAAPSTAVELLWGVPTETLQGAVGDAVGLFGAIELAHQSGPLMLGEHYRIQARVLAVSESPRTESLWFDSFAFKGEALVASLRIMLRYMKASSPLYPEAD